MSNVRSRSGAGSSGGAGLPGWRCTVGFPLRQLTHHVGPRGLVYCTRSLVNTEYSRLFGRRLPGWLGDTLCQTDGRMRQYFRQSRLEVEQAPDAARFLGLPVFHYYLLRKR
jgi:hypothetical protein